MFAEPNKDKFYFLSDLGSGAASADFAGTSSLQLRFGCKDLLPWPASIDLLTEGHCKAVICHMSW